MKSWKTVGVTSENVSGQKLNHFIVGKELNIMAAIMVGAWFLVFPMLAGHQPIWPPLYYCVKG